MTVEKIVSRGWISSKSAVMPQIFVFSEKKFMQHTKQQKEALVQQVTESIKSSKALVFANYKGVTVKDITAIRQELRKSGSSWQVMKKTLLNIALKNAGVEVDARALEGQVGVAFSHDEVAAAKVIADFQKAHKEVTLSIEGGALGTKALSAAEVKALSKLPSQDEMRAKLVGTLQAPIASFVRVMGGNLSGLVQVLKAIEGKKA